MLDEWGIAAPFKANGPEKRPASPMSGLNTMSQLIITALFAIALSFLTFAASFAEVPRSELVPVQVSHE